MLGPFLLAVFVNSLAVEAVGFCGVEDNEVAGVFYSLCKR